MSSTTDTAELVQSIKQLIYTLATPRPVIPADKQLWDAAACAEYLGVSSQHFMQRIAVSPDFPRAINIATGTSRNRRWKVAEIMRWADARQEKKRA